MTGYRISKQRAPPITAVTSTPLRAIKQDHEYEGYSSGAEVDVASFQLKLLKQRRAKASPDDESAIGIETAGKGGSRLKPGRSYVKRRTVSTVRDENAYQAEANSLKILDTSPSSVNERRTLVLGRPLRTVSSDGKHSTSSDFHAFAGAIELSTEEAPSTKPPTSGNPAAAAADHRASAATSYHKISQLRSRLKGMSLLRTEMMSCTKIL